MSKREKIRICEVFPRSTIRSEFEHERAFLGLSVDALLSGDISWLDQFLEWSENRFKEVVVLMGDFLHRHNFVADGEEMTLPTSEAADIAMNTCRPIREKIESKVRANKSGKFSFRSTFDIFQAPAFRDALQQVKNHYDANDMFRAYVDNDINAFLQRKSRRGQVSSLIHANCVNYMIEEIAIFEFMTKAGYKIHLYMGSHSNSLKAIVSQEIQSPTECLANQICVDLSLSKTK